MIKCDRHDEDQRTTCSPSHAQLHVQQQAIEDHLLSLSSAPEVQHSVPQACVFFRRCYFVALTDGERQRAAHHVQHRHLQSACCVKCNAAILCLVADQTKIECALMCGDD